LPLYVRQHLPIRIHDSARLEVAHRHDVAVTLDQVRAPPQTQRWNLEVHFGPGPLMRELVCPALAAPDRRPSGRLGRDQVALSEIQHEAPLPAPSDIREQLMKPRCICFVTFGESPVGVVEHLPERNGRVVARGTSPIDLPLHTSLKQRVEDAPEFR
jgi:hypothetical protein